MKLTDYLFLIAILITLLISAYFHRAPELDQVENPVYPEFKQFALSHGIDVENFARLQPGWKFDPKELPIFDLQHQRVDVLLIGDSSVNYGIEPAVVEQVSGLSVATLAYPAMGVNESLLNYVGELADRLLVESGLVVFMFDPGFWSYAADRQQNQQLNELIEQRNQSDCLFCMKTLRTHEEHRKASRWMQFIDRWLGLASFEFYDTVIEPLVAPNQAEKKFINNQGIKKNERRFFLSPGHVLVVKEEPNEAALDDVDFTPQPVSKKHQMLAKWLASIEQNKVLVLPISQTAEVRRSLYQIAHVLSSQVSLIDLNETVPAGWIVPLQNRTHMANQGIIQQSYLLGLELKKQFSLKLD